MRVTIGERLGLLPRTTKVERREHPTDDGETLKWSTGPRLVLADLPSSPMVPVAPATNNDVDDLGPPRVRGEMVWTHKTAPTLVIEGRSGMTPEEYAAGRRR